MKTIDIVFSDASKRTLHNGPPEMMFVEVESPPGRSIKFGEWVKREDGYWALRFSDPSSAVTLYKALEALLARADTSLPAPSRNALERERSAAREALRIAREGSSRPETVE